MKVSNYHYLRLLETSPAYPDYLKQKLIVRDIILDYILNNLTEEELNYFKTYPTRVKRIHTVSVSFLFKKFELVSKLLSQSQVILTNIGDISFDEGIPSTTWNKLLIDQLLPNNLRVELVKLCNLLEHMYPILIHAISILTDKNTENSLSRLKSTSPKLFNIINDKRIKETNVDLVTSPLDTEKLTSYDKILLIKHLKLSQGLVDHCSEARKHLLNCVLSFITTYFEDQIKPTSNLSSDFIINTTRISYSKIPIYYLNEYKDAIDNISTYNIYFPIGNVFKTFQESVEFDEKINLPIDPKISFEYSEIVDCNKKRPLSAIFYKTYLHESINLDDVVIELISKVGFDTIKDNLDQIAIATFNYWKAQYSYSNYLNKFYYKTEHKNLLRRIYTAYSNPTMCHYSDRYFLKLPSVSTWGDLRNLNRDWANLLEELLKDDLEKYNKAILALEELLDL